jgi:glycosyltransferase involved in cell wall biosynthesis
MACGSFLAFCFLRRLHTPVAVRFLNKAHYLLFRSGHFGVANGKLNARIEKAVRRNLGKRQQTPLKMSGPAADTALAAFLHMPGGLVLKAPRIDDGRVLEKGVVLLKNTEQFSVFQQLTDMTALLREYVLVLEPSWSGYARSDILTFSRFAEHTVVVMAPACDDYRFLERLGANLLPAPFGASDWANPSLFHPLAGQDKLYDAVMVARWTLIKRHHVLFRVLRELADPSFRVALIAYEQPQDTDRRAIENLMHHEGVAGQIKVFQDLSQAELNRIYNQSRVNLLLSRQEGSNRALFEGFFANTPGLALRNNVGLPKSYFTRQTGRLVEERELARWLLYFRENWREFEPAAWARAHITPELTTARLETLLKTLALRRGETWTHGIAAKYNGPDLRYYPDREAAANLPSMADVIARHSHKHMLTRSRTE